MTLPEVGSRWKTDGLRHVWAVERVGRKYVWLRSTYPGSDPIRHDHVMWPGKWKPAHQHSAVDHSTHLSDKRAERQQEAATIARLRPRTGNVENIVPLRPPEPPRAAA